MAVTKGHGNPDWTEDEVILALDLYFELKGAIPSEHDERVRALSNLLRSFPYHAQAARKESFRNPAGVAFKLQNLKQVATGKGLGNTSRMDREVWLAYGDKPFETRARANIIRSAVAVLEVREAQVPDDEVFAEGRAATYAHVRRERSRRLRSKLIERRLKQGALTCDICGYSPNSLGLPYALAVFEAHHLIPLCDTGETTTRLADLALLCANCHRMLHRAISLERRWLTIESARLALNIPNATA